MKARLWTLVVAIAFLGAVVACVMAYRHCAHDWKAIQGDWTTVSVIPSGRFGDGVWSFGGNGLVDTPGPRCRYSINPLLHTITWGFSGGDWARGTYELEGNSLKIWVYAENSDTTVITLKRLKRGR